MTQPGESLLRYALACAALAAAAGEAGLPCRIVRPDPEQAPSPIAIFGAAPAAAIMRAGYPADLAVPWIGDDLLLYALPDLVSRQAGYRFDARDGTRAAGWDDELHVIADLGGTPLSIRADGGIFAARHGLGRWDQRRIAGDLPRLLEVLARWIRFFVIAHQGRILDDGFEIAPDHMATIRSDVLAPLDPDDRERFIALLLG